MLHCKEVELPCGNEYDRKTSLPVHLVAGSVIGHTWTVDVQGQINLND